MGVVNVTPDSFSDGGSFFSPDDAIQKIWQLHEEGADIIDIGAESSRPGANFLSIDEEKKRLEPILSRLRIERFPGNVSLDTHKSTIMEWALDFGIGYINDIRGGADKKTLETLASREVSYIAMHMHLTPNVMQSSPLNARQACEELPVFYQEVETRLINAGFTSERIFVDPGIGFGKSDAANFQLLQQVVKNAHRYQFVVGVSRKSFLGRLMGLANPQDRDEISKGLEIGIMLAGIRMIRTHDVKPLVKCRELLTNE